MTIQNKGRAVVVLPVATQIMKTTSTVDIKILTKTAQTNKWLQEWR